MKAGDSLTKRAHFGACKLSDLGYLVQVCGCSDGSCEELRLARGQVPQTAEWSGMRCGMYARATHVDLETDALV